MDNNNGMSQRGRGLEEAGGVVGNGVKLDVSEIKNDFVSKEINSEKFFEKLKWITTKEAAIYLRLSVGQVRNMVWRGQIKAYRMRNRLRFLKSDLDQIMKSSELKK